MRINNFFRRYEKYFKDSLWELQTIRKHLELNTIYIANNALEKFKEEYLLKQLSFIETMNILKKKKISLVRFGDGEFRMMFKEVSLKFQKYSPEIRNDLLSSFHISKNNSNILIALPHFYEDLHWTKVWIENKSSIQKLINDIDQFGNAHITRPIFFSLYQEKAVDIWREVWKDENILIITGKNSRFSLIETLFDSSKSSHFVYLEPANAYESLNIKNLIHKIPVDTTLILISLGPAGTILSSQLAERGYWALDIGHLPNSYETVFSSQKWPEKLSITKYDKNHE